MLQAKIPYQAAVNYQYTPPRSIWQEYGSASWTQDERACLLEAGYSCVGNEARKELGGLRIELELADAHRTISAHLVGPYGRMQLGEFGSLDSALSRVEERMHHMAHLLAQASVELGMGLD